MGVITRATDAELHAPMGVAVTADGGFLIADSGNHSVRKVSAGVITRVAGTGISGGGGDGGPATEAQLNNPTAVAVTADGGFLIADSGNHSVRKVSAGVITRVAGTGISGGGGDGGPATEAQLNNPTAVAVTADGGFLIADSGNHSVRKVSAGVITRVAGTGISGGGGDGGPATEAQLNNPTAVAVTADGGFLIADSGNHSVRKVAPDQEPPSVTVAASPEAVWQVVSDEDRLGEWSGGWRRYNSEGVVRWISSNKVLQNTHAYRLVWRTGTKISFRGPRRWELNLTADGAGGTRITEISLGRHPEPVMTVRADLARLKEIVEPPDPPVFSNPGDKLTLLNVYTTQFGSYTTMLWQVPALGLTAQAFLLVIALGYQTSKWARIIAAALSIVIAAASVLLMHSQRGRAINQAELVRRVSDKLSLKVFLGNDFSLEDAVPKRTNARDVWDVDHRIYHVWSWCMLLFFVADVLVMISASSDFKWFK